MRGYHHRLVRLSHSGHFALGKQVHIPIKAWKEMAARIGKGKDEAVVSKKKPDVRAGKSPISGIRKASIKERRRGVWGWIDR